MANLIGQIILWAKATLSASEVPAAGQPLYDKANKRLHLGDGTKTTAQQRTAGEYLPPKSEVDSLISTAIAANPGVADHGALTGLGDDDHTQYHNDSRGDARYSPLGHTHVLADVTDAGTAAAEDAATTSAANKVVMVGGTGKIDTSFLPDSVLGQVEYQGTWAANTNTPAIPAASSANKGYYYVATGTAASSHGYSNVPAVDFTTGDWIISNGSAWQKVDNTDAVSSVFGRTGAVVAAASDYDASQVDNDSSVTGATVKDALDTLKTTTETLSAPTATFSTNTNTAQDPGQDTFRFNNGTIGSVTEIALSDVVGGVDKGDLNSRFGGIIQFRPVGTTGTIEFQINSVVHTTWTRYTVTYLKGNLPANGTVCAVRFLPSNTVKEYVASLSQTGTDAPVATVLKNTLGGTLVWSRGSAGLYQATLAGAFPTGVRTVIVLDPDNALSLYANEAVRASATRTTSDAVEITFSDSGDDWMSEWHIDIKVYPEP